jgi:L-2-hydroxyglutarate oxidase LhgO
VQIVPFRGEYYFLVPERRGLVRGLIYPVPDPDLPFLGVHFTKTVDSRVEAGPNAVLALAREGYTRTRFHPGDMIDAARYGGFWRVTARFWKTGIYEYYRSFSKRAFVRSLQTLVPEVRAQDLAPGGAGVRAQAVTRRGELVDDFRIIRSEGALHVLNAPSPAATASLAIGDYLAQQAV